MDTILRRMLDGQINESEQHIVRDNYVTNYQNDDILSEETGPHGHILALPVLLMAHLVYKRTRKFQQFF